MPTKKGKTLCVDDLRHAEYYEMQNTFDNLYARSKRGENFTDLMSIILSRENVLLAYRNIKSNKGSNTPGTDKETIKDIACLTPENVVDRIRNIIMGQSKDYSPKAVRRKDIPKPYDPTKTRPLGIPCIWDRLIQQCIRQVMEPICEAKFSNNSYGFRPNRSTENAIAAVYKLMQLSHLHYVIEFDVKGFFDNVDHSKLIRQIWALGIRDKHLLYVIRQILKAPILMPDGTTVYPTKGTPQGGIISPLLANIVLNELDQWVDSQWQENPITKKYKSGTALNGCENRSPGYRAMRGTRLKEMHIVRYADDFRIFCRTKTQANKTKEAVIQWLRERLRLEVSPEKTRVVNVKRKYSEFLGFKIKVHKKGTKDVVKSHIGKKQLDRECQKLTEQVKRIAKPNRGKTLLEEIKLYNSMVTGIQNYYRIATNVNLDCAKLKRTVMTVMTNRLGAGKEGRLRKTGRALTPFERERYGKSAMMRYVVGYKEPQPVYPIGYVQHKNPMMKKRSINNYTTEGRAEIHHNLRISTGLLNDLMLQPLHDRSIEYADNRISLFSAQWGKCAVTGVDFISTDEIHCHHKVPKSLGGGDNYQNLVLVLKEVHTLIHANDKNTIQAYTERIRLDQEQVKKINKLRVMAGLDEIAISRSKRDSSMADCISAKD